MDDEFIAYMIPFIIGFIVILLSLCCDKETGDGVREVAVNYIENAYPQQQQENYYV